jgi:hypothetical protein
VVSVASRFGRSGGGFSRATVVFSLGPVTCVFDGAGQWWRRVEGSMPCRHACSARLDGACMHGNASHALRAPGGSMASGWHVRGAMHSGSRSGAAQGIDHGGRRRAGGKVTAREGVGAVLPKLGVHGGHGCILGIGGVAGWCHCSVGSREWPAGMVHAH